jgi:mannose-6-phosphate isomerase-like protein (cupin superfamily)
MAHSHTRPDTIGIRDRVSGAKVGLSLVKSISAIFSHTASRVPWHSHNQFELLFVMDGATVYEFQDRDSIELAGGHFMVVPPGVMHRAAPTHRLQPGTWAGCGVTSRRTASPCIRLARTCGKPLLNLTES